MKILIELDVEIGNGLEGASASLSHPELVGELMLFAKTNTSLQALLASIDLRNKPPTDPVVILVNSTTDLVHKVEALSSVLKKV